MQTGAVKDLWVWGQRLYSQIVCAVACGAAVAVRITTKKCTRWSKSNTVTPSTVSSKEADSWAQSNFVFSTAHSKWSVPFEEAAICVYWFTVILALIPVCLSRSQLSDCSSFPQGKAKGFQAAANYLWEMDGWISVSSSSSTIDFLTMPCRPFLRVGGMGILDSLWICSLEPDHQMIWFHGHCIASQEQEPNDMVPAWDFTCLWSSFSRDPNLQK